MSAPSAMRQGPFVSRSHQTMRTLVRTASMRGKLRVAIDAAQAASSHRQVLAAFLAALQVSTAACALVVPPRAEAILLSPNANIARTVDSALRRAIPAFNADVNAVQGKLEDIQYLLRIPQRKPWGSMASDVRAAQGLATNQGKMMVAVPAAAKGEVGTLLEELSARLDRLQFAIDRKDPDKTSQAVARALATVADIEILQAPGLAFLVPKEYAEAPLLTGRAVVELVVEKADRSAAFVDTALGGMNKKGIIRIVLDGYSAPVSAGNFAALVKQGKYDGKSWGSGYASIVAGEGANPGASVPLEILPIGDFSPVYRTPLDIRGNELPVLPLSIRGAVAFARLPDNDQYLSGEQFFIYKFSPDQSGLSGLSFDEGTFGVFGYVVEGDSAVSQLETGDRIVSARLVAGEERLKVN